MKYDEENFIENLFKRIKERENERKKKLKIKEKFKLINEIPLSFKSHWQSSDYFFKNYKVIDQDAKQVIKEFPLGGYIIDIFMKFTNNYFGIVEIKINYTRNLLRLLKNIYEQLRLYETYFKTFFELFELPPPKLIKYAVISDNDGTKIYIAK